MTRPERRNGRQGRRPPCACAPAATPHRPTWGRGRTATCLGRCRKCSPVMCPTCSTSPAPQQLIGLAREHNVEAGAVRAWDKLAREVAERWARGLGPLPNGFDAQLAAVLRDTADVELSHTTVVHGDFHHRNCLVTGDTVTGIFDWDIAGAGDWRFDLVCLAFACAIAPEVVSTRRGRGRSSRDSCRVRRPDGCVPDGVPDTQDLVDDPGRATCGSRPHQRASRVRSRRLVGLAQRRQRGVVQQSVRRQRAAAVCPRDS